MDFKNRTNSTAAKVHIKQDLNSTTFTYNNYANNSIKPLRTQSLT